MTDEQRNAALAREVIDIVWNRGEVDRIPDFYDEGFVSHQSSPGVAWPPGHEGVRMCVLAVRAIFPDYTETPELVVAQGDMVAMRMINRGTHTGLPAGGHAPTGRSFEAVDTMFVRCRDGRLVEQWGLFDLYALTCQLGIAEPVEGLLGVSAQPT
jgi:predicted ester cyclase